MPAQAPPGQELKIKTPSGHRVTLSVPEAAQPGVTILTFNVPKALPMALLSPEEVLHV